MGLTSEIQTPITPLSMNENIKCGCSVGNNVRNNVVPKLFVFSKIFGFCILNRLPCELENARVFYKIKRQFAFFFGEYQMFLIS